MTAQLPPTPPVDNLCGECRLCLAACPTGALKDDGTIDARRCLSYWTIEHRGPIPEEFRKKIGSSLFGCDRCVAVCPWNLKATAACPPEFEPGELPSPLACLELDEPQFQQIFRHSAIRRVKWDGLQRNALIVLGNVGKPDILPALAHFANTTANPDLRELADWARRQIVR